MTASEDPDLTLRYATHADGIVDIYLPARQPATLVILIHGGYWRVTYDRSYLRPMARDLAARGYAVALPEFRRVGGGGQWPAIGTDIETVLRDTPGLLAAAAPGVIDPDAPAVLAGHSAGGHLALWAGLRAGPTRCARIIAVAPVADLYEAARRGLSNHAAAELLGGGPDEVPDTYADANPASYLPGTVPITVLHGDADADVPVELSRDLAAAYPQITYRELAGVDHFAPVDPHSAAFRDIVYPSLTS